MAHRPHCPRCGRYFKLKRLYVRKAKGDVDGTDPVGWVCMRCGSVILDKSQAQHGKIVYNSGIDAKPPVLI